MAYIKFTDLPNINVIYILGSQPLSNPFYATGAHEALPFLAYYCAIIGRFLVYSYHTGC